MKKIVRFFLHVTVGVWFWMDWKINGQDSQD